MFGKMKDMMAMKKQADQLKKELESVTTEVTEVRGIKIVINGSQFVQSLEIDENMIKNAGKSRLENDLLRSFNKAVKKSQTLAAQRMRNVMPDGFPGL